MPWPAGAIVVSEQWTISYAPLSPEVTISGVSPVAPSLSDRWRAEVRIVMERPARLNWDAWIATLRGSLSPVRLGPTPSPMTAFVPHEIPPTPLVGFDGGETFDGGELFVGGGPTQLAVAAEAGATSLTLSVPDGAATVQLPAYLGLAGRLYLVHAGVARDAHVIDAEIWPPLRSDVAAWTQIDEDPGCDVRITTPAHAWHHAAEVSEVVVRLDEVIR